MADIHNSSVGDTLPERYSQEWRTREAMNVFDLLRKEYNDSKRLDVLKRYTELERIIDMFTSEPVMTKLLWLSTESINSSEYVPDIYGDSIGVGVGGGEEEVGGSIGLLERRNKDRNSHKKFLDWIRNITFRIKSSVPAVSKWGTGKSDRRATRDDDDEAPMDWEISCDRHCVQSPKPRCPPTAYSANSMSCLSQPTRPRLASLSYNENISYSISSSRSYNSNLFTFNEGSSPNGFGMTYSHGSSSFRRLSSDINPNQIRAWERIDTTDASSTDRKPAFRRRSGIETCVIRRDNTPEFQIPRQHLAPTQTLQLNPALYRKNDTNGQTTSRNCRQHRGFNSRLQTSVSAFSVTQQPTIGFGQKIKGMLSHDRRQGKGHCSDSSILNHTEFFNDNDVIARSFSKKNSAPAAVNCPCIAKSVEEKAKLLKAYDKLMGMKREYIELNESSIDIPTKYRRMKSMIKTCMVFQR